MRRASGEEHLEEDVTADLLDRARGRLAAGVWEE
jgi:hypothetical protein